MSFKQKVKHPKIVFFVKIMTPKDGKLCLLTKNDGFCMYHPLLFHQKMSKDHFYNEMLLISFTGTEKPRNSNFFVH